MAKRIALVVLVLAAAFAALVATGTVRVPGVGGGAGDGRPAGTGPREAAAPEGAGPGLKGATGVVGMDGGMAAAGTEAPAEEVVPSEVHGTAAALAGGVVRGRVVRAGDAKVAVEGATVRLLRPDSLFVYLRARREGRHDDLVARTDAEGRFTFRDVLPSSGYALLVRGGGPSPRAGGGAAATKTDVVVVAKHVADVGDVVLGKAGGLGGHVADAAGKALAGVRVVVTWQVVNDFDVILADPETLPWVEAETRTGEDGAWALAALEPGDKTIVLKAPSGAATVLSPITVKEGEQRADVDATLGGTLEIAGKVVWDDGEPVVGARAFAKEVGKPAGWTMETGADGAFRFAGLPEGTYQVGALLSGTSVQLGKMVKETRADVVMTFPRGGSLSGTVVRKSSGKPIPRFRVTPQFAGEQDWMQQYVAEKVQKVLGPAAFSSPDGSFRFDRLTPGPYLLIVEADGYPRVQVSAGPVVAGHEFAAPAVEVPDGNRAAGVVFDLAGNPVPECRVYLTTDARAETIAPEEIERAVEDMDADAVTDEHGAFETGLLTPAVYRLGAVAKGRMPANVPSVDLTTGSRRDLKVVLPAGGGIRVSLSDPSGRALPHQRVVFVFEDGSFDRELTDEKGVALGQPLRVGRWAVAFVSRAVTDALWPSVPSAPDGAPGARPTPQGTARYEALRRAPGAEDLAVSDGAVVDVALKAPRLARVSVRVRIDGTPAKDRQAGMTSMWRWVPVTLDAEGRGVFADIEPGTWSLGANVGEEDRWEWRAQPVAIPDAPEHSLEVDLHR